MQHIDWLLVLLCLLFFSGRPTAAGDLSGIRSVNKRRISHA
ncbi:MAG: hypothetical protein ABIK30_01750 [bacterium]